MLPRAEDARPSARGCCRPRGEVEGGLRPEPAPGRGARARSEAAPSQGLWKPRAVRAEKQPRAGGRVRASVRGCPRSPRCAGSGRQPKARAACPRDCPPRSRFPSHGPPQPEGRARPKQPEARGCPPFGGCSPRGGRLPLIGGPQPEGRPKPKAAQNQSLLTPKESCPSPEGRPPRGRSPLGGCPPWGLLPLTGRRPSEPPSRGRPKKETSQEEPSQEEPSTDGPLTDGSIRRAAHRRGLSEGPLTDGALRRAAHRRAPTDEPPQTGPDRRAP